jgi:hypothetical protein
MDSARACPNLVSMQLSFAQLEGPLVRASVQISSL